MAAQAVSRGSSFEQRLKSQMSFAKTRIILLPNDLTFWLLALRAGDWFGGLV